MGRTKSNSGTSSMIKLDKVDLNNDTIIETPIVKKRKVSKKNNSNDVSPGDNSVTTRSKNAESFTSNKNKRNLYPTIQEESPSETSDDDDDEVLDKENENTKAKHNSSTKMRVQRESNDNNSNQLTGSDKLKAPSSINLLQKSGKTKSDKNDENSSIVSSLHETSTSFAKIPDSKTELMPNMKSLFKATVRTQIFRKIKFLTNEKLCLESSIMSQLFQSTGFRDKTEQIAKYEIVRSLLQRQMNSKRNYCTDQITLKAKELMKAGKMFDIKQMDNFYKDEYLENNDTRYAWYVFCYKFLTCVNGDWLRNVNAANAKNKVNLFKASTVSDEAFARWVLEIKHPRLQEEQEKGWPVASGGKKPCGTHDSRQYSSRYAEIHLLVKQLRQSRQAPQWNNMFWSTFQLVQPKFFAEDSKSAIDAGAGHGHSHPDEDEEDDNEHANQETSIIPINDEDKSKLAEMFNGVP